MKDLFVMIMFIGWVAGVVIVQGFWLTALAICVPFFSWYVVVQKIMMINGWL